MTTQERTQIISFAQEGKIHDALERLLHLNLSEEQQKRAQQISRDFKELSALKNSQKLSARYIQKREKQLIFQLEELINLPEDAFPNEQEFTGKKSWSPAGVFGIIGSLASIIGLFIAFSPNIASQAPQLTIFVSDADGNIVLEQTGQLSTQLGNRIFRSQVGEHGRTYFGDVLPEHLGDSLRIGFQAKGWELANPDKIHVFDGTPIHLTVRKDKSLGLIKGKVTSWDEQELIKGAKILINTDTVIFTNEHGVFRVLLPDQMRVREERVAYRLTISKTGFRSKTQEHFVNSSPSHIRLERIEK